LKKTIKTKAFIRCNWKKVGRYSKRKRCCSWNKRCVNKKCTLKNKTCRWVGSIISRKLKKNSKQEKLNFYKKPKSIFLV